MSDRYLRIVLTIIAVELGWLGLKDLAPATALAQAQPAATRVVITGVDLPARTQFLPVAVAGGVRGVASPAWATLSADALRVEPGDRPLRVEAAERPLRVEVGGQVNARIIEPIHVDTSQPLDVRAVVTTSARPGI
jgi:hypothetical protein